MASRARLQPADLFSLFRILRYGAWYICNVRSVFTDQFLVTLQIRKHHRFLEKMAHNAITFSTRLSLLPPRRQSPWNGPALRQPDGNNAAGRPLAWRKLDIHFVGRSARTVFNDQSRLASLAFGVRLSTFSRPNCCARKYIRYLPRRCVRLGFVPGW